MTIVSIRKRGADGGHTVVLPDDLDDLEWMASNRLLRGRPVKRIENQQGDVVTDLEAIRIFCTSRQVESLYRVALVMSVSRVAEQ